MNFYQGMLFLEGFRVLPEPAADTRAAGSAPQRAPADHATAIPAGPRAGAPRRTQSRVATAAACTAGSCG